MGRTIVQRHHQCRHPAAEQTKQVARAYLAVGGFQHAAQASIVVTVGRRSVKHVTQRLFKRIVHRDLSQVN